MKEKKRMESTLDHLIHLFIREGLVTKSVYVHVHGKHTEHK